MIRVEQYKPSIDSLWNETVAQCKNATFLHNRNFMDYHKERFNDCSLICFKKKHPIALFPANIDSERKTIYSHQGLTYGGLLLTNNVTSVETLEIFDLIKDYYSSVHNVSRIIQTPAPYIYHTQPAEEPLYALFRNNATLIKRTLSTTINLHSPIPLKACRREGVRKAIKTNLKIIQATSTEQIQQFWQHLHLGLSTRHNVLPVHSAEEIELLTNRFPENIKLYLAVDGMNKIHAGTWIFITGNVVHTQYMISTDAGREDGALDYLISQIIQSFTNSDINGPHYFDFGISTEDNGHTLNQGLAFQKESFGGRAVCYDTYSMEI